MLHVEFKGMLCVLSVIFFLMSIGFMPILMTGLPSRDFLPMLTTGL